ncbi:hypothetical protein H1R20_g13595, partial [Candolleomyces eurysporus]
MLWKSLWIKKAHAIEAGDNAMEESLDNDTGKPMDKGKAHAIETGDNAMEESSDSDAGKPMDEGKAHAISVEIVIEELWNLLPALAKKWPGFKNDQVELYPLSSDFVIGEMEPIPYFAAPLAGCAVSYESGTCSCGSHSAASETPIEEDAEIPVGQMLKMQILESCDMQKDYARLLANAKSSNVHIDVQHYDVIQSAIQV